MKKKTLAVVFSTLQQTELGMSSSKDGNKNLSGRQDLSYLDKKSSITFNYLALHNKKDSLGLKTKLCKMDIPCY